MLEAEQSYPRYAGSAITRRALLAMPLVMLLPEPIPPPMPITCQPCPTRGMPFQYDDDPPIVSVFLRETEHYLIANPEEQWTIQQ
jgi:hypothetical protein